MWSRNANRCLTLAARQSFIRPLWCQNTGAVDDERAGTRGNSGRGAGPRRKLLVSQPDLAAEQAREILGAVPNHPAATLLLAMARRRSNDVAEALRILEPLAASQPRWAVAQRELGLALGDAGRGEEAVAALRTAVRLQRRWPMPGAPWATTCMRWAIPQAPTRPMQPHP